MAKKKNYNPFKMWGSYMGIAILVILSISFINIYNIDNFKLGCESDEKGVSSNIFFNNLCPLIPSCSGEEFILKEGDFSCGFIDRTRLTPQGTVEGHSYNLILLISFISIYGFLVGWGIHSLSRRFS